MLCEQTTFILDNYRSQNIGANYIYGAGFPYKIGDIKIDKNESQMPSLSHHYVYTHVYKNQKIFSEQIVVS